MGGAGRPVSRTGTWPRAGGARRRRGRGNWPAGAVRPGKAPPSHTWRGLADSARPERLASNWHGRPATAGMRAAMIRGHDRLRARVLSGCAATEGSRRKVSGRAGRCAENQARAGLSSARGKRGARSADRRSGRHRAAMTRARQGCRWYSRTLRAACWHVRVHRPGRWIRGPPVLWRKRRPPVPAFVRDLIHEVLASGASGVSCKRCYAHPLRAARPGTRPADRPVCTSMWITCAKRRQACAHAAEMLGIPPAARPHIRVFSWENTTRTLCTQRKPELSTRRAEMPPE